MDVNWMENVEAKKTVIKKFNEEFGNDITKLDNYIETKAKFDCKKNEIERSLSVNGTDVPSKISSAMRHVQEALQKIDTLSEQHNSLRELVTRYQEKVNNIKTKAEDYINKITDLEKACEYLKVIQKIEETSALIELSINEKNEKKQVMNYVILKTIHNSLKQTRCIHLQSFANETLHYWYNILKERYGNEYDGILKAIKWPFVYNESVTITNVEIINKFQILTQYLLQIELAEHDFVDAETSMIEPISLPMKLLIKPLRKRFAYHFMGARQTNRADKPEWYFTQTLTWIRDHQDFIEKNLQPIYDKMGKTKPTAKIELMQGLVQIVVDKLHLELSQLNYDDSLFSHCIDEALGFDKELRSSYGYPSDYQGVIKVLTKPQVFSKWIDMERRYAIEKVDRILTSPTAFDAFVSRDIDENRITECAENFLALFSTLTERYEILPQPHLRLRFLELQVDILSDFGNQLLKKLEEDSSDPFNSNFPSILNTLNYVQSVLEEWGSNTFFLNLQILKCKMEGKNEVKGTVFDSNINFFKSMTNNFLIQLLDQAFMDVKAKSMPYRKDKWHVKESPKDVIQPTVTATACPMFQVLIERLHQLQDTLAADLFQQSWNYLATAIDEYLYDEIVAICVFNEGGCLQFNYDITRNLFPLFGQYSAKPESHFKLLKDSCLLLTMSVGLALTLQEGIMGAMKAEGQYKATEILEDVGIYTLKETQVLSLLSRRIDLC